ncbi:hypothetical protein [Thermodesulfovibrio sp. TK110]
MRTKSLVWVLMSFIVFPVLSFAQMKPQIPPQVKIAKTYWCAEVQDILFTEEPQQGQKLTVGVRVKFTKKTIIPGAPGQKLCSCAFEGPSDAPAKFWSKTMSLRLIGVKYSETETNLLEYYGPTPAFPPYDYGGFPVIGFVVTENDLKKGYIDVWGWASKEPLQCRDSAIYASFAVYNQSPYNQQNECHPHSDFKKSFRPKCLHVPKIPEEAIKKGTILRIPPEKFSFQKLPPIKFYPFARSNFIKAIKIINGQEFITLKNGKTILFDKFLKEVNEIEEKLNKAGYTLRDKTPVKIHYMYPADKLNLQKAMFLKQFRLASPPPENTCQSIPPSTKSQQVAGCPRDFIPLNWEKSWDASFGDENFGVVLGYSIRIDGGKEKVDIKKLDGKPGFIWTDIKFFGKNIHLLLIDKDDSKLVAEWLDGAKWLGGGETNLSLSGNQSKELFNKEINYSQEISFPMGPIDITGEFGFKGKAALTIAADYSIDHASLGLTPYLLANAYGQLAAGYEIVEVGVEGDLILIKARPTVNGSIKYIPSPNPSFQFTAKAINNLTLLSGRLSVYAEIDYWLDSKKFEVEFFKWDGITLENQPLFYTSIQNEPAEKCHSARLKIEDIRGITPYTARNEKLEVEPIEFDVIVNIGERSYVKTLKDYNKDGIYGKSNSIEVPFSFDIPLLSTEKVPIIIEVKEKYKIGTFDFQSDLDFAKGETKKVELCYDPNSKSFSGLISGKEEDEIVASGDTSYWGEKHHSIRFKITSESLFKPAPAKAK